MQIKKEYIPVIVKDLENKLEPLQKSYAQFGNAIETLEHELKKEFKDKYQNDGQEIKELGQAYNQIEELYKFLMQPIEMEIEELNSEFDKLNITK